MGARQAPGQVRVGRAGRGARQGWRQGRAKKGPWKGHWQVRAWPLLAPALTAGAKAYHMCVLMLFKNHQKITHDIK